MSAVDWFRPRLEALGDPETAASQRAYMKSRLRFHGVVMKQLVDLVRAFQAEHPALAGDGLAAVVDALYAEDDFDLHSAAVILLERLHKRLGPGDLDRLVDLIRRSACWAHVDQLATKSVGSVLARHPAEVARVDAWAVDPDFWVRRTALICQLDQLRKGQGDLDRVLRIMVPMLPEKEFFVRKAIGWVLRDVSKKRPEPIEAFLAAHAKACSGLTWREATRQLPGEAQERLARLR